MNAPQQQSPAIRNAIASEWMKHGIALLNKNSAASLSASMPCFERAIELRRSLPLREHPWYGYVLAAGWMNRGDALTRLGSTENLAEAVRSYDQALALLRALELESNSLFRKRLALAWMNRGITLQEQGTPASLRAARASFDEAIAVLRDSEAFERAECRPILACGLTNRGNTLLRITPAAPGLARESVEEALTLVAKEEEQNIVAAETGLKARHVLCRAIAHQLAEPNTGIYHEDLIAAATDAADDGTKLARNWEARGERRFCDLAGELFQFGALAYQMHQPHFLAEFLLENLDPFHSPDAFPGDRKMHQTANEAIDWAFAKVRRDIFGTLNTPQFDRFLKTFRHLRTTKARLGELRPCSHERGFRRNWKTHPAVANSTGRVESRLRPNE